MSKTIKSKFKIIDMHCSSCSLSIDLDLEKIPGVVEANTNYALAECEVCYEEEKVKPEDILKQIEKTGYSAQMADLN